MIACPDLSVVVIPLIGQNALASCLDRLPLDAVECIVVLREDMGTALSWKTRYPSATFVETGNLHVPQRRRRGIEAATGGLVALLEDSSWPDETWCAAIRSTFADEGAAAVGGPVNISAALPSRWQALGWSEYGAFAPDRGPPLTDPRPASIVPGNNMAFRRAELIDLLREEGGGLMEGAVCAKLRAREREILYQPLMRVTFSACDPRMVSLATRFHHGRIYGAWRLRSRGPLAKFAHAGTAMLLPVVLTARAAAAMIRAGGPITGLAVLFWLALMESARSLGEGIGALSGAGKSMDEWR